MVNAKELADNAVATSSPIPYISLLMETPRQLFLARTIKNEHFIAITAEDDKATAMAMLQSDPTGKPVSISPPQDEKLHFYLEEGQ